MIHLLVPMSGQGVRYQQAGYQKPKPLIPIEGVPMIERLLSKFPRHWPTHFVLAENHRKTELPDLLKTLRPQASIRYIAPHSFGPGHALKEGLLDIPEADPVLVSYCDYGMVWDSEAFERFVFDSGCDATLLSYRGFHPHYLGPTKYAYSLLEGERVIEVREKSSFTAHRENEFASCGGYYFKSAGLLKAALAYQYGSNLKMGGEFYTSLTVQALLQLCPNSDVRIFEIERFFQWGTPEDLESWEYWYRTFTAYNQSRTNALSVDQVLIPMAGLGSRFESLTALPKPLIPIRGIPMFQAAIGSLPQAAVTALVLLDQLEEKVAASIPPSKRNQYRLKTLVETPPGQAFSVEAGLSLLNPNLSVIVSSCDHSIVLDSSRWNRFIKIADCDAAIFTQEGYPGAQRRPNSYAYVIPERPHLNSESKDLLEFPVVKTVSVKAPISADPSRDPVLVGTFWFRSAEILARGIAELKRRNVRVNGELYLDSVFEVLRDQGMKVRMIPLDGYICWGDPDALAESVYWEETFCGRSSNPRPKFYWADSGVNNNA